MRLLIIDDEDLVRRSLRRAAESRGHIVSEANNGESGLSLWRAEDPDLVLLDVLMPRLTGPQVLRELGVPRKAKVILISAYTGEYDLDKAKNLGADLFIPKPFHNIFDVIVTAEQLIGTA
jgi:two-component system, response regulator PdtaR